MTWTSRTIRRGASRVDFDRQLVVFRKPVTLGAPELAINYQFVQLKYDGLRLIGCRDWTGNLHAFSTRPTDLHAAYPKHPIWLVIDAIAPGDWLDMELFVPGGGREQVKTHLVQGLELDIAIFGCSYVASCANGRGVMDALQRRGLPAAQWYDRAYDKDLTVPANCDGIVYKDSMYGPWARKKNKQTADLLVTGIVPGCGKYFGQCGALRCSDASGNEVARVSGMDDSTREQITSNDIGRIVEVAYERVASKGRLQHTRFVDWRDDKTVPDRIER